jgi:hypothetical protein
MPLSAFFLQARGLALRASVSSAEVAPASRTDAQDRRKVYRWNAKPPW